jgi:hypothetical protein
MVRRLLGGAAVAVLVLAVAVTPLSATFRPAFFDVRYVDPTGSVLAATLEDQTGLVSAFAYAPQASPTSGRTTTLVVDLSGGCRDPNLYIRFMAVGEAYRLVERTSGSWCQLLDLQTRRFALALRAPIDSASVEIVSE